MHQTEMITMIYTSAHEMHTLTPLTPFVHLKNPDFADEQGLKQEHREKRRTKMSAIKKTFVLIFACGPDFIWLIFWFAFDIGLLMASNNIKWLMPCYTLLLSLCLFFISATVIVAILFRRSVTLTGEGTLNTSKPFA